MKGVLGGALKADTGEHTRESGLVVAPDQGRILALLFTDVVGSTRLWERFPSQMKQAVAGHDALSREACVTPTVRAAWSCASEAVFTWARSRRATTTTSALR